ncbi:MAG: methionyl-tRNA formyltransferase, partial [bacterium (Candidatus Ratteibacteria) CG_4_9_14_3_um_filter_41_21]
RIEIKPEDTARSLSERMAEEGASLLLKAFSLLKEKKTELKTQNEAEATFAPKLKKSDGLINWKRGAVEIHNLVRGLAPWPSGYMYLEGKRLKIWDSEIKKEEGKPGEILKAQEDQLLIACGKGSLLIKSLQREGKRRMAANEFLRGHPLKKSYKL